MLFCLTLMENSKTQAWHIPQLQLVLYFDIRLLACLILIWFGLINFFLVYLMPYPITINVVNVDERRIAAPRFPVPARTSRIQIYKPFSSAVKAEYNLGLYERLVQVICYYTASMLEDLTDTQFLLQHACEHHSLLIDDAGTVKFCNICLTVALESVSSTMSCDDLIRR